MFGRVIVIVGIVLGRCFIASMLGRSNRIHLLLATTNFQLGDSSPDSIVTSHFSLVFKQSSIRDLSRWNDTFQHLPCNRLYLCQSAVPNAPYFAVSFENTEA
jgi:hypothetical protein